MTGPLLFRPLYQERVWGGRTLAAAFGRELPPGVIGESWEIVDRAPEQSVVTRGIHTGRTLRDLLDDNATAIMGAGWDARRRFPILVKWLDCRERLSLQVHPPAAIAAALKGEPKTEHWYIANAEPHAALMAGLRRGVTADDFKRGLANDTLEPLVHRIPVQAGDSLFVQSGRIHAIDAGNLILEIQQNSDTTYRVYDWGRVDSQGRSRQLHVEESLRCIDFADFEPELATPGREADVTLADCAEFRIRRYRRQANDVLPLAGSTVEARILSVVHGAIRVDTAAGTERYVAGDNVLLPADTPSEIHAESTATVLLTDRFSDRTV